VTGLTITSADMAAFAVALARTSALVATAPVLGDRTTPAPFKAVVAAAIAAVGAMVRGPLDPAVALALIPMELMLGLVTGLVVRMILAGVDTGGQIIGMQMGLGIAGQVDPMIGDEALPTRRLLTVFAGLSFLGLGGLEALTRAAIGPLPDTLQVGALVAEMPWRAGDALVTGARIAAPLLVAGMVVSASLALASRGAPAVNVFSIDLSLRAVVSIAALVVCAPAILGEVTLAARRSIDVLGRLAP
jgi:flagellar biosynthetic protein FliR